MQFVTDPVLPTSVNSTPSSQTKFNSLAQQVSNLIEKQAISKPATNSSLLLSRIFTVKKANGEDRLIIDLSKLNTQIVHVTFQMESYTKINNLLEKDDYMTSIDLCDAFFSVPIHPDHRKFLAFEFNNNKYVFNVLPFGLTSSPRIFSKVLKPVIIFLRSQGIRISFYLDDIFLCSSSYSESVYNTRLCLNLLESLGFNPNYKKSFLTPSHSMQHLGYLWDSKSMSISIPPEKIIKTKEIASLLLSKTPTLRELASFLGRLVSHSTAYMFSALHYRNIQLQHCLLIKNNVNWDHPITLSPESRSDILWWISCPVSLPSRSLLPIDYNVTLKSDASSLGWGGYLSSRSYTSGIWSKEEADLHINILELKAVFYCVSSFIEELKDSSLQILSDNMTTVYYINKIGGTHSEDLCLLSVDLWQILLLNNIKCFAFHIKGSDNTVADQFSRSLEDRHDYHIPQLIFSELILHIPFNLNMDVFASCNTYKIPSYVSLLSDPHASAIDAFSFHWSENLYLFPPIPLIPRVVQKIKTDHCDNILLITPAWPGLISVPTILSLMCSNPIFIPSNHLQGQIPTRHPFCLIAWPLSTHVEKIEAYQKISAKPSIPVLEPPHSPLTKDTGNNFVNSLEQMGHSVVFLSL